jgi:hypothetical protein
VKLVEIAEAVEALRSENRTVAVMYMSTAYFTELTKLIPMREAKPGEATGLRYLDIPVHIDNISGYKLIALDADGYPVLTFK